MEPFLWAATKEGIGRRAPGRNSNVSIPNFGTRNALAGKIVGEERRPRLAGRHASGVAWSRAVA